MADDPEGRETYVYDVVKGQSYLVTSKGGLSHWFPDGNALVIRRIGSIGVHGGESLYMVARARGELLLEVAISHTDFPVIACPATDARLIGPWEVDLAEGRVWTAVEAGRPIDWSSDGRYALVLEGSWGSERNLYFFDRLNNNYRHLFTSHGGLGAVEGAGVSGYLSPRATWARIIAAVAGTFDREVLLARTDGREIITASELPGNWDGSITFSADDRWAVYGSQNGWALIDLETRTTHTIPGAGSQWPEWLIGER